MKSKVLFTRTITPEKVLEMYEALGKKVNGKIAFKLHSGEEGNQNFLGPDFWKPVINTIGGTVRVQYGIRRNKKYNRKTR